MHGLGTMPKKNVPTSARAAAANTQKRLLASGKDSGTFTEVEGKLSSSGSSPNQLLYSERQKAGQWASARAPGADDEEALGGPRYLANGQCDFTRLKR